MGDSAAFAIAAPINSGVRFPMEVGRGDYDLFTRTLGGTNAASPSGVRYGIGAQGFGILRTGQDIGW